MLQAQIQRETASTFRDEEAHRLAYNAAFRELGLGFSWDADTYRELCAIGGEKARISAYLQRHGAHLLKAYDVDFLSRLIYDTKLRQYEELNRVRGSRPAIRKAWA